MKIRRCFVVGVSASSIASLFLAGCGGGKSSATQISPPSVDPFATAPPPVAAPAPTPSPMPAPAPAPTPTPSPTPAPTPAPAPTPGPSPTPAPTPTPSPPPTPAGTSATITAAVFDWSSHQRQALGSDNWPITWSDDDRQYALWGDGGGFGGTNSDGRSSFGAARIEGDSTQYAGLNRFGGKSAECASSIDGKGHGAPLSIGGVLFAWVTPGSGASGFNEFRLYRSRDKACTWEPLDVVFTRAADGIAYGGFVQFGKDNTLARDNHVYVIATAIVDASSLDIVQRPGKVMLLRAPQTSLTDRGAYEYFAGLDGSGQPTWSSDSSRKTAVYEDVNGVGPFPQVVFVPGINRFVYTNQHGDSATTAGAKSLLTMAQAAQPWGPWSVFYRDVFFPQLEQSVFQWSFAPKWFRNNGRDFTLIFSGTGANDSWNTVNGTFTTSPGYASLN